MLTVATFPLPCSLNIKKCSRSKNAILHSNCIKSERKERKSRKEHLLSSIKLPGRGLPLKMAAACPKENIWGEGNKGKKGEKRRREKRGQLNLTPEPTSQRQDLIYGQPLSLALSLSSTSTSLYSFSASSRMLPSLWKRKRSGRLMSSVLRPSPAIWKRGAVSLLLPSLSSEGKIK